MLKKSLLFIALLFVGFFCYYFSLTTVKKNRVKRVALHTLGILESDWKVTTTENNNKFSTTFKSPTLFVDDIYTSMQGPYSFKRFKLNENEDELYWITKFQGTANSKFDSQNISNDFICHVNLYHSDVEHFARMGLEERINIQESQLITLTKGTLSVEFPKGFGYPIYSNEKFLVGSQALNLNKKNEQFKVNYSFKMDYYKNKNKRLKPLYMRYVVLAMPYKEGEETLETSTKDEDNLFVLCAGPSSNRRFKVENEKGEKFTGFWKVPKGEYTYVNNISNTLNLKQIETVHLINAHVHPYAESIELKDATTNTTIFKSIITNSKDKKGIEEISEFSSVDGVKLFPSHQYNLILKVNNTTNQEIDMMGSMFLYFYDEKLDKKMN